MPCRAKVALDGMDTRDIDDFIIKEPRTLASIAQTNAVWRPRGPTHEATAKKTLQVNNHVETLRPQCCEEPGKLRKLPRRTEALAFEQQEFVNDRTMLQQ